MIEEQPVPPSAMVNAETVAHRTPRIVVAQLGARMHYAVPRILHEAGMLERLYTDSYIGNKPWLERALDLVPERLQPGAAKRLLGRKDGHIPPEKVTSFDALGLAYARAQRRAKGTAALARVYADFAERFGSRIIADGPADADAVWCFNGAALELFRWAKPRGVRCILEQTIAPRRLVRRLLAEELERWPGWQPDLELPPEADALAEREQAEWQLADRIVAGSQFVVDGIEECGGPVDKCVVVPYGVDLARFGHASSGEERRSDPRLRVLFAGEVGLRKGAPYLLEALRALGPARVEAKFAGRAVIAREKLEPYRDVASFLGPVPRSHMPALYRWADVFVLPSICEGSATVVYEALAAGLPVVCTPNTGSIVQHDRAGYIVPPGEVDGVVDALERIAAGELPSPAFAAGAGPPPWSHEAYARRLVAAVADQKPAAAAAAE